MEQYQPSDRLSTDVMEEKQIADAKALLEKHGLLSSVVRDEGSDTSSTKKLFGKPQQKRDDKAREKEQEKQRKLEDGAGKSTISKTSKYSVGSKLLSGATVKEVKENDWEFVKREGGRDWFVCK